MTRSYGNETYRGRQTVDLGPTESLTTSTNASSTAVLTHTFMYPCKVVDWNISVMAGATDLTAVEFNLSKSLGGTGTLTAFGTCDLLLATATIADGTNFDGSATTTSFVAGDDVSLAIDGTVGHAMILKGYMEVQETYVQSDT